MKSVSRVGLALSIIFAFLFLALICEIYYLLWWKRRATGRRMQDEFTNTTGDFFYLSCLSKKKKINTRLSSLRSIHGPQSANVLHSQSHLNNELNPKPFDEIDVEIELMVGPPRFLFTIIEETKEDLESENGKSKVESGKLCDLMRNAGTPYMTPVSSPAFYTPPLTPSVGSSHSRSSSNGVGLGLGYNPFYESSTDVEFSKIVKSSSVSPPPMFKFLRDAEEKLQKKSIMAMPSSSKLQEDGILMATARKKEIVTQQRQVLPLASSPFSTGSSSF